MKGPRILAMIVAALLVAFAVGCGGDDDEEETTTGAQTTTEQTTPAEGSTSTVRMDEYEFDPEDVVANRRDTVTVRNDGNIAHNLTVEQGPDPEEKGRKLAGTSTFLGGRSEKLAVNLEPGRYAMVCTVPGHRQLGMVGTFTVR